MRLLCISSHADTRNSVRPEAESFIGLQRNGVDVTVMTQQDSSYADDLQRAGITLLHQQLTRKFSWQQMRRIRKEIRARRIDAVYAFNNKAICTSAFACIGLPVAMISYRGQTGNIRRVDPSAYLTHLHPRIDAIVGVSQSVVDDLRREVSSRVVLKRIYKGHSLEWYNEPPSERGSLGLDNTDFVVGCVANNRPRKGVEFLIRACGQLADVPNLRLLLIGSGMDEKTLGPLLQSNGIADKTLALGPRSDATRLIQTCNAAVLPSIRREGLPKTVIEAMAYGVPTVVTDTGGNAELVAHGESGFVVPVEDASAISGALRELHGDRERASAMGRAGKQRIETHFHVSATVRETRDLLNLLTLKRT
ncbi:MAG: glycosyltransferase family 4 protein [Pseudomonadota bacterium]